MKSYEEALPGLIQRFQQCEHEKQLCDVYEDFVAVVKALWLTMAAPKPGLAAARFRPCWTRQLDALAKKRAKHTRVQVDPRVPPERRQQATKEARRINLLIRRTLKQNKHAQREALASDLRQAANTRDSAAVARVLRSQQAASATAGLGEALNPVDLTTFFADKPEPDQSVPLRHFDLPESFRLALLTAIVKAKCRKAPGPDGIPVELYKMLPDRFADVFFALFTACGRLAAVIPGWDLSVLIPIYKGKGPEAVPANHRPLRLIPALKKIFGIALDSTIRGQAQNEFAQFGFQTGTSSSEALVLAIAHTQLPGLVSISVDQKGAYDTINRAYLMKVVDTRTADTTAALVAMMLQPSQVYTKGDVSKTLRSLAVGLTQGGPESPTLFNIEADELLRMIAAALAMHRSSREPIAAKAFADDLLLQLLRLLNAKRALAACGRWAMETGQVFTVAKGKSAYLRRAGVTTDLGLTVNGKTILPAEEFQYLGVTLTAAGPSDASLTRRVGAATAAMSSLREAHVLVRGMNLRLAYSVYTTFVISRWTYAAFLQPLTQTTASRLDAIDAAYISSVLVSCRVAGPRRSRSKLPTMRALLRLPSPALRRKVLAHRYAARLLRISRDSSTPAVSRARARAAWEALPLVPSFPQLVPDPSQPWGPHEAQVAREAEWRRASLRSKRPVPPPVKGALCPPAVRLRAPWASALAARYHCATFPILSRPVPRQGPRRSNGRPITPLYERAQLTERE